MGMVLGYFFDAKTATAVPVTLRLDASGRWVIRSESGETLKKCPVDRVKFSERFSNVPRRLYFDDGSHCDVADHQALARLLDELGHQDSRSSRLTTPKMAALSLLLTAGLLIWGYLSGLPLAAGWLANQIPYSTQELIGSETLASLDEGLLSASQLPDDRQNTIREAFYSLRWSEKKATYKIVFRSGGEKVGANAFALPGGTLVITDELVALADNTPHGMVGLLGILAHEVGHVEYRHGLQQAIQATGISAVLSFMLGDVSSVALTLPTLMLNMRYSRDHEREADAFAVRTLGTNGLDKNALINLLLALDRYHQDKKTPSSSLGDLVASHPQTQERVAAIRETY